MVDVVAIDVYSQFLVLFAKKKIYKMYIIESRSILRGLANPYIIEKLDSRSMTATSWF